MAKCTGRNGTYVCQYDDEAPHKGMHFQRFHDAEGTPKIAKWVDHHSAVSVYFDSDPERRGPNLARVDAASAYITTRIRGERTSDHVKLESAHLALQIGTEDGGVVFTGGRDELIELGSRIIQQATIAELRREGSLK